MANKKSFPGIFVVIIITFAVYLTIVVGFIYMHYKKPAKGTEAKKINISCVIDKAGPPAADTPPKTNDRIA
jgi:hypothetical protein